MIRGPRQHVTGLDGGAIVDRENGPGGHEIACLKTVGQRQHLALVVAKRDSRTQVGAASRCLPVNHLAAGNAGCIVGNLADRDALGKIDIVRGAGKLGNDRHGVGVPLDQHVTRGNGLTRLDEQLAAIGQAMTLALTALLVEKQQLGVAGHDDLASLTVFDKRLVLELHLAADGRLDVRLLSATLRGATDMEGPHRQLRSGLADRLRGDDTDSSDIDRRSAGEVAT